MNKDEAGRRSRALFFSRPGELAAHQAALSISGVRGARSGAGLGISPPASSFCGGAIPSGRARAGGHGAAGDGCQKGAPRSDRINRDSGTMPEEAPDELAELIDFLSDSRQQVRICILESLHKGDCGSRCEAGACIRVIPVHRRSAGLRFPRPPALLWRERGPCGFVPLPRSCGSRLRRLFRACRGQTMEFDRRGQHTRGRSCSRTRNE